MIPTALDERIRNAIRDLHQREGKEEFDPEAYIRNFRSSAQNKARAVLREINSHPYFRDLRPLFLSIGGGDGTELDWLLRHSSAQEGILIEEHRQIADMARNCSRGLQKAGRKTLDVRHQDAAQPQVIAATLADATRLVSGGKADFIAVTCHAVIHELFDRGHTNFSPAAFFGALFENYEIPIWLTYREPGVPARWTDVVRIGAECNPSSLKLLATEIGLRHPSLRMLSPDPTVVGGFLRLHAELAMELLVKLFYLEDLPHEIEERVTAGKHVDLISELNRALTVPAHIQVESSVVSSDFPSTSFASCCRRDGIRVLVDDGRRDLGVPQSHTAVTAWRTCARPLLVSAGPQLEADELPPSPASSTSPNALDQSTQPFDIAVDGITINYVGELLVEDPQTKSIRQDCWLSYRRSLEDFAFAVVYGRRILTGRSFRPSLKAPNQPGVELVRRLGDLAGVCQLSSSVAQGGLLHSQPGRTLIADHLASMADCVTDPECSPFFKDWLTRESKKYLGEDPTLFSKDRPAEGFHFGVAQPYYMDRDLQDAFPPAATKALMRFVPRQPKKGSDAYSTLALREFVTQNVLSLVTIMLEYDLSAEQQQFWRLPHVLRGLVKRRYWRRKAQFGRGSLEKQEILRGIVVRHALVSALKRQPGGRSEAIEALMELRDLRQFKAIRRLLQELGLLYLRPGDEWESNADSIIRALYEATSGQSEIDQLLLHPRFLILRNLKESTVTDYDRSLYRVFPELCPPGQAQDD